MEKYVGYLEFEGTTEKEQWNDVAKILHFLCHEGFQVEVIHKEVPANEYPKDQVIFVISKEAS